MSGRAPLRVATPRKTADPPAGVAYTWTASTPVPNGTLRLSAHPPTKNGSVIALPLTGKSIAASLGSVVIDSVAQEAVAQVIDPDEARIIEEPAQFAIATPCGLMRAYPGGSESGVHRSGGVNASSVFDAPPPDVPPTA